MYTWFYCAWGFRQTLCSLDPNPRGQGNTGLFEEVRHSIPEHLSTLLFHNRNGEGFSKVIKLSYKCMWIISSTLLLREVRNILSISNSIIPVPTPSILALGFFSQPTYFTKGENKRATSSWHLVMANSHILVCTSLPVWACVWGMGD